ncbi:hypothetical protein ACHAXT_003531 [Thalassiosira profunda]
MKVSAVLVAATAATASAFAPAATNARSGATELNIAVAGKVAGVRKSISTLTKDNFSSTLTEIEPFLTQEAGRTIYTKSLRRINVQAKALGVEVPAGYAKEAKCTQKRRERQDAYCKAKAEEAEAAAAEAAEAEAAAADAEVEAAADVEVEAEAAAEETADEPALVEA